MRLCENAYMEVSDVAVRLKALRDRTGLSVRKFAELIGLPASKYQHYEDRFKKPELPLMLVVTLALRLNGRGTPSIAPAEVFPLAGSQQFAASALYAEGLKVQVDAPRPESAASISEIMPAGDAAARVSTSAELPVYSSAEGGAAGAMVLSTDPIDYVKRPEPLFNVRAAFACYVIGDSMSPAYETGDMILVHPSKPVRGGDDCLFARPHHDGGMDALVKRLVRQTADHWRVKQYNPAKDFDLKRADWQQAMLIVGKYARR